MKAERKRKLIVKDFRRELRQLLQAYSPTHPKYARNIKELFEGLTDSGIVETIETESNLKKFKRAFELADKTVKTALVMAHHSINNEIPSYISFQNERIASVKLIGNVFLPVTVSGALNEEKYREYKHKQGERLNMINDREIFRDIKEFAREIKKDERDLFGKKEKLSTLEEELRRLEEFYSIGKIKPWKEYEKSNGDNANEKIEKFEELVEGTIESLNKLLNKNRVDRKQFENLKEATAKNFRLNEDALSNEIIQDLTDRVSQLKAIAHEANTKRAQTLVEEVIPNLMGPLEDVKSIQNVLRGFRQGIDHKRKNIEDPWDIWGYGSGGVDKRSGLDPDEGTAEERDEGFFARKVVLEMIRKMEQYEQLIFRYTDILIEDSSLKTTMQDICTAIIHFIAELYRARDAGNRIALGGKGRVIRDPTNGQILNIEAFDQIRTLYDEITNSLEELYSLTTQAIGQCSNFIETNRAILNRITNNATRRLIKEGDRIDSLTKKIKKAKDRLTLRIIEKEDDTS